MRDHKYIKNMGTGNNAVENCVVRLLKFAKINLVKATLFTGRVVDDGERLNEGNIA